MSPSYVPEQGQQFVIINNDGTDPVSGTFSGKPEGSVITLNTVYQFVLSYVGGSGNDVVLTSLNGLPLPGVTLLSSLNPSTPGQNVTFTATVSGSGPVPTGTVTFFDGASVLATNPLNGGGVATYSTTALAVGTVTAQYNSDSNYGGNVSSALAQVVGQASQFLTFNPPPSVTIGGTGTVVATSANPNSGNAIQYSTASPACSVNSSTGLVNGLQVGVNNCTITATQAGNANYLTGTATQILSISKVTSSTALGSVCMRTFVESQPFTCSAVVTGLGPTGTVTFDDGNFNTLCSNVVLSGGTASCTSSVLASASPSTVPARRELQRAQQQYRQPRVCLIACHRPGRRRGHLPRRFRTGHGAVLGGVIGPGATITLSRCPNPTYCVATPVPTCEGGTGASTAQAQAGSRTSPKPDAGTSA